MTDNGSYRIADYSNIAENYVSGVHIKEFLKISVAAHRCFEPLTYSPSKTMTPIQHRAGMRYQGAPRNDVALRLELIRLAKQYGRYGYRMIAELLRAEGWHANHKKVERLWREEGLQLPARHKKRKRPSNTSTASTIRGGGTQPWAGKARSHSKGKWFKRALGAALKRDRSIMCNRAGGSTCQ